MVVFVSGISQFSVGFLQLICRCEIHLQYDLTQTFFEDEVL